MLRSALTALLVLPSPTFAGQAVTPEDLYARALPSIGTLHVETIEGTKVQGTAFLAVRDGVAITAWHVVQRAKRAMVRFSDGEEFESSGLIDWDAERDVAMIRVAAVGRALLPLAAHDVAIGSRAYVVGSPRGLDFTISDGLVSQVQTVGGSKQIQFSCPASPGNSGGPLLDAAGSVIGVVSWQLTNGQNLNFATPAAYAFGLDASLPTTRWQDVPRARPDSERRHSTDTTTPSSESVVVSSYRTQAHRERSSPEVFQQVTDGLLLYLDSSRVAVQRTTEMSAPPSIYGLVLMARDIAASAVLLVTVDRPWNAWVKISVDAYDTVGTRLWTESDSEGGGLVSGDRVVRALEKLKAKLSKRLGSTALPLRSTGQR